MKQDSQVKALKFSLQLQIAIGEKSVATEKTHQINIEIPTENIHKQIISAEYRVSIENYMRAMLREMIAPQTKASILADRDKKKTQKRA